MIADDIGSSPCASTKDALRVMRSTACWMLDAGNYVCSLDVHTYIYFSENPLLID